MLRLSSSSILVFAGVTLAASHPLPGAETPVVELPKVVVTETSLQEREHWRHTEIPGFEILSQANDATIQQLVQELELLPLITRTVWPGPVVAERTPTTIILCRDDKMFAGFIPESVRHGIDPTLVDRLFLKNDTEEVILFRSAKGGDDGRFKELLRDFVRRSFLSMKQTPPDWFVTGMAEIIADADYHVSNGQLKIRYAGLGKPPSGVSGDDVASPDGTLDLSLLGTTVAPPTLYETEKPSPAVREIIRGSLDNRTNGDLTSADAGTTGYRISHEQFTTYFRQRPYHSDLLDILDNKPSLSPDEYRMTCWAFVHLCAFGEQRRYGAAFGKFLTAAAKNPTGDTGAMFRDAFGRGGVRNMEIVVSDYCNSASSPGVTKTVPAPDATPAVITDAAPMLIGQIKADAYRLAGHPAEADAEIKKARRLTHVEPAAPR